ncbi:hypothetical protein IFM89_001169, partial [Coptis chinensis]
MDYNFQKRKENKLHRLGLRRSVQTPEIKPVFKLKAFPIASFYRFNVLDSWFPFQCHFGVELLYNSTEVLLPVLHLAFGIARSSLALHLRISKDNVCGSVFYLRMAQQSVGLANWHRLRKVEQKSLKSISGMTPVIAKELHKVSEDEQVYQFLLGLRDEYETLRCQILGTFPLPSPSEAYVMVLEQPLQEDVRHSHVPPLSDSSAPGVSSPSNSSPVSEISCSNHSSMSSDQFTTSSAHSIGIIDCQFFHNRLYNFVGSGGPGPSLEPGFLNQMRSRCNNSGDLHVEPGMNMDYEGTTRSRFGTHYYKRLVERKGILHADQQLMTSEATASWVQTYSLDNPILLLRPVSISCKPTISKPDWHPQPWSAKQEKRHKNYAK